MNSDSVEVGIVYKGGTYKGEVSNGVPHGQGTYTYASGEKHVGEYKDGKSHGQGTVTFADGRKYVGEFKDDNFHGQGTLTGPNGDKYVGEFKDGNRWDGTKYDKDGNVTATWLDGVMTEK